MSNVLINEGYSISVDIYKCSNVLDHSFSKVDISLGTFLYASKELQSKHRQTAGYSNKMLISITDIISITRTFNMVDLLKLIFRIDRPNASTQ